MRPVNVPACHPLLYRLFVTTGPTGRSAIQWAVRQALGSAALGWGLGSAGLWGVVTHQKRRFSDPITSHRPGCLKRKRTRPPGLRTRPPGRGVAAVPAAGGSSCPESSLVMGPGVPNVTAARGWGRPAAHSWPGLAVPPWRTFSVKNKKGEPLCWKAPRVWSAFLWDECCYLSPNAVSAPADPLFQDAVGPSS